MPSFGLRSKVYAPGISKGWNVFLGDTYRFSHVINIHNNHLYECIEYIYSNENLRKKEKGNLAW